MRQTSISTMAKSQGRSVSYLCPEAQVQDASAADSAMWCDLNHPALFVARDDVHFHAQVI